MKKKCLNLIVYFIIVGIWLLFSVSNVPAVVYPASEYMALYDFPQTFYYYTQAGVSTTQVRTGYRYQYDYDDPIIRCQKEGGTCAYESSYLQYCGINMELSRYKVYIPPGTVNTFLATYLEGQSSRYVVVARLGQPPVGDYDSYTSALSEQGYLSLPTGGFSQTQLKAGDCIGANNAGILTIATGGMTVASEADGGWLYVIMLPIKGFVIGNSFNNRVDTAPFMSWFKQVDWTTFGSNVGSIVNPTPTPTPPPPGCVFGCDNNFHCVDGECVPNSPLPTPTPAVCDDFVCSSSGGLCVSGQCVIGSPVKVGDKTGLVQASPAAAQTLELLINSTNSYGDIPAYEWFLLTATIDGNQLPLYVISDKGFFDFNQVLTDLYVYTFSFNAGVTSIGMFSMSDLGLQAGDTFVYGYAYQKQSGGIVIDNIVILTVK
jgi:hypothetical protein